MGTNSAIPQQVSDFGFFGLDGVLKQIGVEGHSYSRAVDFFWREARSWTADSPTEFASVARTRLAKFGKLDKPAPRIATATPSWTPCLHWGGTRLCERCDPAKRTAVAGSMARAEAMYMQHKSFVRKRLHAELQKYPTGKGQHPQFDDIEQLVWQNVTSRIDGYFDHGLRHGPLAWLRAVVFSTVADYFKSATAPKRGEAVTFPLTGDVPSQSSIDLLPARPNKPEGDGPDDATDELKMDMAWRESRD